MLELSDYELRHLYRILNSLFHSADYDKPLHQILGYSDFQLIQKISLQIRPDNSDWPKQPKAIN
tara:strand:+ start:231 stop:422 length:192 start_codon:yes stop_codon:yes gene_type:complete